MNTVHAQTRLLSLASAALVTATVLFLAGASIAQTAPRDPVSDLLATDGRGRVESPSTATTADGERYSRAREAEQDPDEIRATRALNAEVTAQNELAENQERADREAIEARASADLEASTRSSADHEADNARYQAALAEQADAQARYELAMADWRATVRACEVGDRARCRAGSLPARVPMQ